MAFVVSGVVGTGLIVWPGVSPVGASGVPVSVSVSAGVDEAGADDDGVGDVVVVEEGADVLEDGSSVLLPLLQAASIAAATMVAAIVAAFVPCCVMLLESMESHLPRC